MTVSYNFKVACNWTFFSPPYHPTTPFPSAPSTKGPYKNIQSQSKTIVYYFIFTPGPYVEYSWLPEMSPKLPLIAQSWVCSYHGKGEHNLDIVFNKTLMKVVGQNQGIFWDFKDLPRWRWDFQCRGLVRIRYNRLRFVNITRWEFWRWIPRVFMCILSFNSFCWKIDRPFRKSLDCPFRKSFVTFIWVRAGFLEW